MHQLRTCSLLILTLLIAACATTPPNESVATPARMDKAEFESYNIQVVVSEADQVVCDYGPIRMADYPHTAPGEYRGQGGTAGFFAVYRTLNCTWVTLDGHPRQEVVDMPRLLKNKHVEWEHIEGEQLVEHEPIMDRHPYFRFYIQGRRFKVVSEFTVMLLGDRIDATRRNVKPVDISRTIYERK